MARNKIQGAGLLAGPIQSQEYVPLPYDKVFEMNRYRQAEYDKNQKNILELQKSLYNTAANVPPGMQDESLEQVQPYLNSIGQQIEAAGGDLSKVNTGNIMGQFYKSLASGELGHLSRAGAQYQAAQKEISDNIKLFMGGDGGYEPGIGTTALSQASQKYQEQYDAYTQDPLNNPLPKFSVPDIFPFVNVSQKALDFVKEMTPDQISRITDTVYKGINDKGKAVYQKLDGTIIEETKLLHSPEIANAVKGYLDQDFETQEFYNNRYSFSGKAPENFDPAAYKYTTDEKTNEELQRQYYEQYQNHLNNYAPLGTTDPQQLDQANQAALDQTFRDVYKDNKIGNLGVIGGLQKGFTETTYKDVPGSADQEVDYTTMEFSPFGEAPTTEVSQPSGAVQKQELDSAREELADLTAQIEQYTAAKNYNMVNSLRETQAELETKVKAQQAALTLKNKGTIQEKEKIGGGKGVFPLVGLPTYDKVIEDYKLKGRKENLANLVSLIDNVTLQPGGAMTPTSSQVPTMGIVGDKDVPEDYKARLNSILELNPSTFVGYEEDIANFSDDEAKALLLGASQLKRMAHKAENVVRYEQTATPFVKVSGSENAFIENAISTINTKWRNASQDFKDPATGTALSAIVKDEDIIREATEIIPTATFVGGNLLYQVNTYGTVVESAVWSGEGRKSTSQLDEKHPSIFVTGTDKQGDRQLAEQLAISVMQNIHRAGATDAGSQADYARSAQLLSDVKVGAYLQETNIETTLPNKRGKVHGYAEEKVYVDIPVRLKDINGSLTKVDGVRKVELEGGQYDYYLLQGDMPIGDDNNNPLVSRSLTELGSTYFYNYLEGKKYISERLTK